MGGPDWDPDRDPDRGPNGGPEEGPERRPNGGPEGVQKGSRPGAGAHRFCIDLLGIRKINGGRKFSEIKVKPRKDIVCMTVKM